MLINLVSIHPYPSPQSVPLANAFLKAYAHEYAESIELTDFFLGQHPAECADIATRLKPQAIGFSMYLWNRELCSRVANTIRCNHPEIKLFCGGPEATAAAEAIIESGIFDFVVVGEGEMPFLALCKANFLINEDTANIPGVLLSGHSLCSPTIPIKELDSIPSPYLTGIIDTNTFKGILWQLSRGCSFTCDFCFDSRGVHGVRHFSLARLEAELRWFANSSVSQVFVLDSTFNVNPERAKQILKMIKKYAPDIHFHFEVRSEFIDREMAKLFSQITCSLQIGLQSADSDVLKLVGRSFNKNDFTKKIGLLNNNGAVFGFDLIYGLPGDTLAGFCRSLDYALSLYPNHLDIFPLAVLPGTRLSDSGSTLNVQWDTKPPYLVTATDCFSVADIETAAGLATACDIFYTRGKAVAWFNAVLTALSLKPSEFLSDLSKWLIDSCAGKTKESDYSDDDVWNIQQSYIRKLFSGKKVSRLLPLVVDLVTYHHYYAEVLQSTPPVLKEHFNLSTNLDDLCIKLAPSTRIVVFTYNIEELLECGEPQLLLMYEHFSPEVTQTVIYNNGGAVCTESLAEQYITLLKLLVDGNASEKVIKAGLTDKQAREFILFALQEGILTSA